MTEDDVLASLEQMKKDAPQTAPKEGSMAAMASDATKSPSAMNKAPSSDPFEGSETAASGARHRDTAPRV